MPGKKEVAMNADTIWADLEKIRAQAPLVHNITNYVVMNNTANALLALGASPVMAHARTEVADMTRISGALVLNIGTLSDPWVDAMFLAAQTARTANKPIIIDPVGVGATPYRTDTARSLWDAGKPPIIRGNASEIMALAEAPPENGATKGADSTHGSDQALAAATALVEAHGCAVCISGETDFIRSPHGNFKIANGHPMMPRVTGLGCTATAICGAFAAVNPQGGQAAAHAMAIMGIAGEMAAEKAEGPGSLQMHFIDALYQISAADIQTRLKGE